MSKSVLGQSRSYKTRSQQGSCDSYRSLVEMRMPRRPTQVLIKVERRPSWTITKRSGTAELLPTRTCHRYIYAWLWTDHSFGTYDRVGLIARKRIHLGHKRGTRCTAIDVVTACKILEVHWGSRFKFPPYSSTSSGCTDPHVPDTHPKIRTIGIASQSIIQGLIDICST